MMKVLEDGGEERKADNQALLDAIRSGTRLRPVSFCFWTCSF